MKSNINCKQLEQQDFNIDSIVLVKRKFKNYGFFPWFRFTELVTSLQAASYLYNRKRPIKMFHSLHNQT